METQNNNREEVLFNQQTPLSPANISSIKLLGGLASLFALGSIIPYLGFLLSIASIVLFLIAFNKISNAAGKRTIFNNILIAYLIAVAFGIGIAVYVVFLFVDFFKDFGWSNIEQLEDYDNIVYFFKSLFGEFLTILGFAYVISIVFAYLWKTSLDKTATFFNEKLFKTAGLLFVIGAFSIILCGIGSLVMLAGYIVLAIAFFSLKAEDIQRP